MLLLNARCDLEARTNVLTPCSGLQIAAVVDGAWWQNGNVVPFVLPPGAWSIIFGCMRVVRHDPHCATRFVKSPNLVLAQ